VATWSRNNTDARGGYFKFARHRRATAASPSRAPSVPFDFAPSASSLRLPAAPRRVQRRS